MASQLQSAGYAQPGAFVRPAASPLGGVLVAAGLAALHLAMYGYDLLHPARFLNADRADERLAAIQGFAQALHGGGDLGAYFATHGIVGDWLPQALLYIAGGPHLVIGVQVLLALVSVLCVRDIGIRLGLAERRADAAALLYGLLPHTLVLPHVLAAEGLSVPLVVISFALAVRGLRPARQARAGLAMGLATLVRPVTMLWPFVHALFAPGTLRARLAYLLFALAPLAAWVAFIHHATGEISTGPSAHNLAFNLNLRMQRIAETLPPEERPAAQPQRRTATPGEYLAFVREHPRAVLSHSGRDMLVFAFKSGIERLVLDYLGLFAAQRQALQDTDAGWRAQVDTRGLVPAALSLFRASPALVTLSAASAALFGALVLLAVAGALGTLRRGAPPEVRRLRLLLVVFVLYVLATAQVVDAVQSRHRAPAEFALCLLAVAGWSMLARRSARHAG